MAASLLLNGVLDLALGIHWRERLVHAAEARHRQMWGAAPTCALFRYDPATGALLSPSAAPSPAFSVPVRPDPGAR